MRLLRTVVVAAVMVCLCTPVVTGQEKKGKVPAGKLRGQLPQNYGKLGLNDAQKQRIYGIQATYRDRIDVLEQQIEALKEEQRKEIEGVLSADQRSRLRAILSGKAPGGE
jgi:hypothetical protein